MLHDPLWRDRRVSRRDYRHALRDGCGVICGAMIASLRGRKRDDTNINALTGVHYILKRYLVKAVDLPKGRQPSLCPQVVNAKMQRARARARELPESLK